MTLRVEGFPPSIDASCRLLILGSAPSVRSLERAQYYGHPQNLFWPFMEQVFRVPRGEPYAERLRLLRSRGVALWDVVHRCARELSADATIDAVEPNDFAGLFRDYRSLRAVAFNGAKSEQLFRRRVLPDLGEAADRLHLARLPSTSPANASIPRDTKLAAWTKLLECL